MNYKQGFKRITWILSFLMSVLGFLICADVNDDYNYDESLIIYSLWAISFFVLTWIVYFFLRWVILGFTANKETSK